MPNDPSQARRELDAMETQLRELRHQMESKPDPEAQKRVDALTGLVGDLRADLDSHKYAKRVELESKQGDDAGVEGTPTFFINGKRLNASFEVATVAPLIDEEVKR